ncbi:alpha-amylase family protein [Paenibacillus hodogayensis]|uniref:Alpha-amylase family protein n=1 Tax=Paenibacillus hodogayensis TaxID=279208 RepID=A0ABV5VR41_9BACL
MRLIKRAVHLDFHTLPDIPDFGGNFDAERFAHTLKEARVDFINVFAKCNIGFAYYPTKIGLPHPHLKFDMLGQMVEECHKLGIGVAAYFNVGLDHEMARKHREWTVVNKDGQVLYGDRTANFFRLMCLNSGYRDYLLGMIKEVCELYPVDGIFLDCILTNPCYGNECMESIRDEGNDPLNDKHVSAFMKRHVIDFFHDVKQVIRDDMFFFPNGLGHINCEGLGSHIEIECLPGAWSYDYFAAQAAYTRNLGKQVVYMTGRFHASWGDFGGLKSKASLEYDCWDAISQGLTTSVGDHMHPRDGLEESVYRMIGEVYADIEAYEPWTDYARAVTDIGIVMPEGCDMGANNVSFPQGQTILNAAARMLGELKYTFDIVDERADLSAYKVIILPDVIPVNERLRLKLENHLAAGGGIVSTGSSGLNPEKSGFALDAWNMEYAGQAPWNASYFKMPEASGQLAERLCAIYNQGILLKEKPGARPVADYYKPYFNRDWDGFHGTFYTPPDTNAGYRAIVRSGSVFQIGFQLFSGYADYAMPEHKYALGECLKQLLDRPVVKTERIPSTARVTVTAKDKMRMIHIKATYPELRGKYNVIEEHSSLRGGVVSLRGESVGAVYAAPSRQPIPYTVEDGYIRIPLPDVEGYAMVVVEG